MPAREFIVASAGLFALLAAGCSGGHEHGETPQGAPSSVPIAPITSDALFVVNGGDSSISVIDTEKAELSGVITLTNAPYPHHLDLSDDRTKLLVAVPGVDLSEGHGAHDGHGVKGGVLLLDAASGETRVSRLTETANHNAAFGPGEDEVWTTQMAAPGSVLVLAAATLETKQTVTAGDGPAEVTFSADGLRAFVANGASNSVTVIDAATKEVIKTISVGENPVGAWQGASGVAYVDNETDKTVTVIDTKTLDVLGTRDLGFTPGMVAVAPGGEVWVADADAGRVVIFTAGADMLVGEIATGAGAHGIAFSGDGELAYVSNQAANTVSIIDVAARKVVKSIPVGEKPNGLVWRAK